MNENEEIRMDCGLFEATLHDLDRPGTPGLAMREVALAHAESCSGCAQLLIDNEALDFSLQTIAAHDGELQASPRVEAALLAEMRSRRSTVSRRRGQWYMAALGAAAVVLLALGLAVRHVSILDGKLGTASGIATERSSSPSGSSQIATSEEGVAENVADDSQDATAFMSLPYATDPGALEGGTVVRVELSRSALASMGMPVTDVGATDQIPADIVLSEDGAPQAIRLVSSASLNE